jgi:putative endonuclease
MQTGAEVAYWVYILTNKRHTVLYVGVTNDLIGRLWDHRHGPPSLHRFTSRYNVTELVYYEQFGSIIEAIAREKQIKSWSRAKKEKLITEHNPTWVDLSREFEV